jgi:hypothetical protein
MFSINVQVEAALHNTSASELDGSNEMSLTQKARARFGWGLQCANAAVCLEHTDKNQSKKDTC